MQHRDICAEQDAQRCFKAFLKLARKAGYKVTTKQYTGYFDQRDWFMARWYVHITIDGHKYTTQFHQLSPEGVGFHSNAVGDNLIKDELDNLLTKATGYDPALRWK